MAGKAALCGALALLMTLVASLSASAAFPGQNGKIVFGSQQAGEDEIWVMNADGSNRHNLTRHDGRKVSDIDPRWSSDGRRIVFASNRGGSTQIWVMNANGSAPTQLTNLPGRNRYPAFTADGRQIVFQSVVAGNFEIYRMSADGSDVTNLTNDPGVQWAPATAPRGKKVVFTQESGADGHLHIWSPDEPLKQVTSGSRYDYFANWSPSGNDLVFVRFEGAEDEIYTAHADGTGARQLTDTPGVAEYFPAFSPDGKRITFTRCGPPRPTGAPNPVCSTHVMNLDGSGVVDLKYPTPPVGLTDDFDDNQRNVDYWSLIHDGAGGTVAEQDGQVQFTLAEDSVPSGGSFPAVRVSYDYKCTLTGDFDVRVDYELLEWPAENGALVQLQSFYADANVARQSQGAFESYAGFVGGSNAFGTVGTTDQAGTLRLRREGATFAAYAWENGDWTTLVEAEGSSGEALLVIGLASYGPFAGKEVSAAFDNFVVTADTDDVDCSSSRPDWHPDWQPLGK